MFFAVTLLDVGDRESALREGRSGHQAKVPAIRSCSTTRPACTRVSARPVVPWIRCARRLRRVCVASTGWRDPDLNALRDDPEFIS
jgi:hypothetical protein